MTAATTTFARSVTRAALYSCYEYSAYSLHISSELELPELPLAMFGATDVVVRFAAIDLSAPQVDEDEESTAVVLPDGSYLYYAIDVGKFHISEQRIITIDPHPEVDEQLLRIYLLGPAIGLLLHQRGELALHASAVRIDGQAVVFLGESGEGKSTLAAFLQRRGHEVVTDDVLVVRAAADGRLLAQPGYRQMKLWPDSLEAFGDDPATVPLLHSSFEKRCYRPERGFVAEALPLAHVYVLGEAESIRTLPLLPHAALLELISNTYALRFIGSAGSTARHFAQCAALLSNVSIDQLLRPRSLAGLADVADLVESNLRCEYATNQLEAGI